ncbi:MAG: geranylgeranylglycerol-phosphate geranylgeranyltransferase [Saprospiraceae bacterium]
MVKYLRLVRFPNLIIVALTQYLLQFAIVIPSFKKAGLSPTLPQWQFALFVLTTMLIAAGGYIINDLIDYPADVLNKPHKVIIKQVISSEVALRFYFLLFFSGLSIALYLAFFVGNPGLVMLFPVAWGLLWLYSRYLKQRPLAGNVTVAFFCAAVAGIVLFAEREGVLLLWGNQPLAGKYLAVLSGGYLWFAFSTTFIREVIKDLEDMDGDAAAHCRTVPIVWGVRTAKLIAGVTILLLIASLLLFSIWLYRYREWTAGLFCLAGIGAPLFYLLEELRSANIKPHYTRLSTLTKYVMAAGLLLLVLIWMS